MATSTIIIPLTSSFNNKEKDEKIDISLSIKYPNAEPVSVEEKFERIAHKLKMVPDNIGKEIGDNVTIRSVLRFENADYSIFSNQTVRDKFINDFVQNVAIQSDVDKESVQVNNLTKGSVLVDYQVVFSSKTSNFTAIQKLIRSTQKGTSDIFPHGSQFQQLMPQGTGDIQIMLGDRKILEKSQHDDTDDLETAEGLNGLHRLSVQSVWFQFVVEPLLTQGTFIRKVVLVIVGAMLAFLLNSILFEDQKLKEIEKNLKLELEKINKIREKKKREWYSGLAKLKEREDKCKKKLEAVQKKLQLQGEGTQSERSDISDHDQQQERDGLVKKARKIRILLNKKASSSAEESIENVVTELYKIGKKLIRNECRGVGLFMVSLLPVVVELSKCMKRDIVKDNHLLLLILTRPYRLFLQLVCYQLWHQKRKDLCTWPIRQDVVDDIFTIAETWLKYLEHLPTRNAVLVIKFEWLCVKEAATCLKDYNKDKEKEDENEKASKSMWSTLLQGKPRVQGNNENKETTSNTYWMWLEGASKKVNKKLVVDWKRVNMQSYKIRSSVASWYDDIHKLQWLGACISEEGDFDYYITNATIITIREYGGMYSFCLATIFMDIIDTSSDRYLQLRAFKGSETQTGLLHLLNWHQEGLRSLVTDDFEKTRLVVVQYLWQLVANGKPEDIDLRNKSLSLLKKHHHKLMVHKRKLSDEDNHIVKEELEKLERRENSVKILEAQQLLAR